MRDHYDKRSANAIGATNFVADSVSRGRHVVQVLSSADLLAALRSLKEEGRTTNAELARILGLPSSRIAEVFDGKRKVSVDEAKTVVEHFGIAGALPPTPDQPPTRTVDAGETAPVQRLDLSYSMGPGTDLDDSYIESEPFEFDLGFLRGLTVTPPDRIRIVDGIGDSMIPTLHDRDLLFVDINQNDLNAQDRIWAIWLFGLGAVKRLRAVGPDKVLVISDNPEIENQEVSKADIMIHGRVIGSIKRH